MPNPELAVIQFYALTVYPHVVRSMFGIRLDPQATEELLTSGVNTFLCYYRQWMLLSAQQFARVLRPRCQTDTVSAVMSYITR